MDGLFDQASVSSIGLGTWQMGMKGWGQDYAEAELMGALSKGISNGLNFIDTAEIYGNGKSESLIGETLKQFDRKQYFIATKVAGFNASSRRIESHLVGSLNRLDLDYVDLYQVHWEPSIYTSIPDLFRELERLHKEGLVNHIGVSNFSVASLKLANDFLRELKIESNQIKFNVVERPNNKLLEYMKTNNIKLIAWSPLAQGFLSGKYSSSNRPAGGVRRVNSLFSAANFNLFRPVLEELRRISADRKVSPIQVVLAYEKQLGVLPIPGFRNTSQVNDLISANFLVLSEQEIASIESTLQQSAPRETSTGFYPRLLPNFIARFGSLFI